MALGVEVDFTANVAKFSNQVDKITGQIDGFSRKTQQSFGLAKTAIKGFVGAFAVSELTSFVRSGIDMADSIRRISQATGAAAEDVAGLRFAFKTAGAPVDEVAQALNDLSIYVAENGEAMRELGVTAKEPVQAFLQFSDVFSRIEDVQKRSAVASKIFGDSFGQLAPVLEQGADRLRENVELGQKYVPVSAEMAQSAADFNRNLAILNERSSQAAVTIAGPLVNSLLDLTKTFDFAQKQAELLGGSIDGLFSLLSKGSALTQNVKLFEDVERKIKEQQALIDNFSQPGKGRNKKRFLDLDAEQKELNRLLAERQRLVDYFGIESGKQKPKSAPKPSAFSDDTLRNFLGTGNSTGAGRTGAGFAARNYKVGSDVKQAGNYYAEANAHVERWLDLQREAESVIERTRTPMENLNKEIELYSTLAERGFIGTETLKRALDDAGERFNSLQGSTTETFTAIDNFAIEASRNMQDAFAEFLFDPFRDGASGMAENFGNAVRRMLANAASAQILETLLGKTSANGKIDFTTGVFGALISAIPGFATGGYHPGGLRIVGERGPELEVTGPARIYNAQQTKQMLNAGGGNRSGDTYVTVNVQARQGEDAGALGQRIAQEIARSIAREEIRSAIRPGNILNPTNKV